MISPELYRTAVEGFGRRVEAVTDDQWTGRVPCCPDWDVRDLVAHVTDEARWTPPLLAGEQTEAIEARLAATAIEDPRSGWSRSAREATDAVAEPGAMDRKVQLPSRETTGRGYVSEVFADTLIHTWDLARAIGGDDRLDPEAVDACSEWFDENEQQWRDAGAIGPAVAVSSDADAQTRLLARFGRAS